MEKWIARGSMAAAALLLLGAEFLRLRAAQAGFPAETSDAGAHILIIEKLRQLFLWPVPYQGMLGSHATALLPSLFGLDVARAMLLVSDLSLLLTGFVLCRAVIAKKGPAAGLASLSAYVMIGLPLGLDLMKKGFLPQIVSWAPYALALSSAWRRPTSWKSVGWAGLGGLCYPDGALWILPWVLRRHLPGWGAAVPSLVLMAVQFRLRLVGGWAGFPSGSGFYALALSVVLACAAWMKPANKDFDPGERDLRGILVLHLAWSSALWILAWAESSQLPYYPRKNIYFLALSLPVIFGFLWPRGPWARWLSVATLAIFFAGIPSMTDQSFGELLARAVRPRSHFDSGEESCVRSARRWLEAEPAGLCRVSAAFPHSRTVRSGESADGGLKIRSFALNGLLAAGRIDPDVGVRLSALGDRAAANPHAEGETDEDYLARAKPADLPSVECWFYRDSLYGPSGQRLYSCRR